MDCCTGWTKDKYHDDECPWFNALMDALNAEFK